MLAMPVAGEPDAITGDAFRDVQHIGMSLVEDCRSAL